MAKLCVKRVYLDSRDVSGYVCRKPATVERRGDWYCNVHDPDRPDKVAKRAKAQERYDADMRKRRADWEGGALLRDLAPADPAAGAAALRALVAACRSLGLEGTDAPIAAALAQLEVTR